MARNAEFLRYISEAVEHLTIHSLFDRDNWWPPDGADRIWNFHPPFRVNTLLPDRGDVLGQTYTTHFSQETVCQNVPLHFAELQEDEIDRVFADGLKAGIDTLLKGLELALFQESFRPFDWPAPEYLRKDTGRLFWPFPYMGEVVDVKLGQFILPQGLDREPVRVEELAHCVRDGLEIRVRLLTSCLDEVDEVEVLGPRPAREHTARRVERFFGTREGLRHLGGMSTE